jgi:peptidoglycan/LPS O-acetylase OafA/YrhL
VMLYHIGKNVPSLHFDWLFRYGFTGVDLFLVLSGFLITSILLQTRDQERFFTNFYARRALRIWPLYYSLLVLVFVLLPMLQPQLRATIFESARPWQVFPFFLQNYLSSDDFFGPLQVTWTLAIEEQFYLVWPVIVWLAPRRLLKPLALGAIVISIVLRFCVARNLLALRVVTNPLTRLDGLGLGAFLAVWIPESDAEKVKRTGTAMIAVALPCIVALLLLNSIQWGVFAVFSLCYAGLLCLAINTPLGAGWNFLKYTGTISYGLYLLHAPSFDLARDPRVRRFFAPHFSQTWSDIILVFVSFAIAYALSATSWHFFESRILKLKSLFETRLEPRDFLAHAHDSTDRSLPVSKPGGSVKVVA